MWWIFIFFNSNKFLGNSCQKNENILTKYSFLLLLFFLILAKSHTPRKNKREYIRPGRKMVTNGDKWFLGIKISGNRWNKGTARLWAQWGEGSMHYLFIYLFICRIEWLWIEKEIEDVLFYFSQLWYIFPLKVENWNCNHLMGVHF